MLLNLDQAEAILISYVAKNKKKMYIECYPEDAKEKIDSMDLDELEEMISFMESIASRDKKDKLSRCFQMALNNSLEKIPSLDGALKTHNAAAYLLHEIKNKPSTLKLFAACLLLQSRNRIIDQCMVEYIDKNVYTEIKETA